MELQKEVDQWRKRYQDLYASFCARVASIEIEQSPVPQQAEIWGASHALPWCANGDSELQCICALLLTKSPAGPEIDFSQDLR